MLMDFKELHNRLIAKGYNDDTSNTNQAHILEARQDYRT